MHLETRAIHAGQEPDPATGAITAPIHPSTTFERDADGGFSRGFQYTRYGNPNRNAFEKCVSSLEGGAGAAAFGSGMAAIMSVLQTLQPGDHVVAPDDLYFGVRHLQQKLFRRWGLQITTVDLTRPDQVRAAMTPATRLLWSESPSNPLVKVCDVQMLADIAHESGAQLCVDNTWATPVLQRPFELGADLVVHSATKYLSGHSDVLAGVVVTHRLDETFERLVDIQSEGGAVPSPFDCWLIQRGLQTLPCRVRTQCAGAAQIAQALAANRQVEAVFYPGLADDPGHEIASRQMADYGAMLSFCVRGGEAGAMRAAGGLELIRRATSLGGTHSLIEHRASIEGPDTMAPPGLLRLSVGLEHPDDLIADLQQALG